MRVFLFGGGGSGTGGFRAAIPAARGHTCTLLCPPPSFPPFPSICSGFDKYSNSNPVIFETSAKISFDFDKFPPLSYIMYARDLSAMHLHRVLSDAFCQSCTLCAFLCEKTQNL